MIAPPGPQPARGSQPCPCFLGERAALADTHTRRPVRTESPITPACGEIPPRRIRTSRGLSHSTAWKRRVHPASSLPAFSRRQVSTGCGQASGSASGCTSHPGHPCHPPTWARAHSSCQPRARFTGTPQLSAGDATCQHSACSPAPFNPRAGVRFPAPFSLRREHPVSRREHLPAAQPCAASHGREAGHRHGTGAGTQTLTYQPGCLGKKSKPRLRAVQSVTRLSWGLGLVAVWPGSSELALAWRLSVREGTNGVKCTHKAGQAGGQAGGQAACRPSQLLPEHTAARRPTSAGTSPSLDRDAGFRQRRQDGIPATATATAGEGWRGSTEGQRGQGVHSPADAESS